MQSKLRGCGRVTVLAQNAARVPLGVRFRSRSDESGAVWGGVPIAGFLSDASYPKRAVLRTEPPSQHESVADSATPIRFDGSRPPQTCETV